GLKDLAPLTGLQMLCLYSTEVGDAGLKDLLALTDLRRLLLWDTAVTDAGLKDLAALKHLRTVEVQGTKVTAAGLEEFKAAVPLVTVKTQQVEGPGPGGAKPWLMTAQTVGLLLTVTFLGLWLAVRQGRRAGKAPAGTPVQDRQATPEPAPAPVPWSCPG